MNTRQHVRCLLRNRRLSIRELARASGVRRASILRFLHGGNIHLDNLQHILTALGYTLTLRNRPTHRINVPLNRPAMARLCRKHHVSLLALFGSVLREDFSKTSDIDILADFAKPVGFFALADFEHALRKTMRTAHPLDIVTIQSLSPLIADQVIDSSEVVYAQTS